MELNKSEVLRVLREKKVEWLYHANTVRTINTFLRSGHLLSRGSVQDKGLDQTYQTTDESDKKIGVWHDIFLDGCEVHKQASKRNLYGPILLQFSLDLLEDGAISGIWVAKSNPKYWPTTPQEEWWFTSIAELEANYDRTNFGQHIVIRSIADGLPLNPYLKNVIIDNPNRERENTHTQLLGEACGALRASYRVGLLGHPVGLTIRDCSCRCVGEYQNMKLGTALALFEA